MPRLIPPLVLGARLGIAGVARLMLKVEHGHDVSLWHSPDAEQRWTKVVNISQRVCVSILGGEIAWDGDERSPRCPGLGE